MSLALSSLKYGLTLAMLASLNRTLLQTLSVCEENL